MSDNDEIARGSVEYFHSSHFQSILTAVEEAQKNCDNNFKRRLNVMLLASIQREAARKVETMRGLLLRRIVDLCKKRTALFSLLERNSGLDRASSSTSLIQVMQQRQGEPSLTSFAALHSQISEAIADADTLCSLKRCDVMSSAVEPTSTMSASDDDDAPFLAFRTVMSSTSDESTLADVDLPTYQRLPVQVWLAQHVLPKITMEIIVEAAKGGKCRDVMVQTIHEAAGWVALRESLDAIRSDDKYCEVQHTSSLIAGADNCKVSGPCLPLSLRSAPRQLAVTVTYVYAAALQRAIAAVGLSDALVQLTTCLTMPNSPLHIEVAYFLAKAVVEPLCVSKNAHSLDESAVEEGKRAVALIQGLRKDKRRRVTCTNSSDDSDDD